MNKLWLAFLLGIVVVATLIGLSAPPTVAEGDLTRDSYLTQDEANNLSLIHI